MKRKKILSLMIVIVISLNIVLISAGSRCSARISVSLNMSLSVDKSTWFFTPLELVSGVSDASSYLCDLQIDSFDNIHLVWKDFSDYNGAETDADIFYRKWSKNTSLWSSTKVISANSIEYSDRASMMVDNEGNVHVVWDDDHEYLSSGSDLDLFYRKWSIDSGTWSDIELVSSESPGLSFDPSLTIDSSNNLHIVWNDMSDILSAGVDRDIFYKMWFHENSSWSTTQVLSTSGSQDSHHPEIDIDDYDNLHVVWDDESNILGSDVDRDIFYRKWDSDLKTWQPVTLISSLCDTGSVFPKISAGNNRDLFVTWHDFSNFSESGSDADVFLRKWEPYLGLWTDIFVVSAGTDSHSYSPTIDVDVYGSVHIAWYQAIDFGGSGFDRDIYYRSWDPSEDIWSDISLISRASTDDSWEPELRVNSAGHQIFSWYDQTNNLLASGSDSDIFVKKFVGAPEAPILESIFPNPAEIGNIELEWNHVIGVNNYSIYKAVSEIVNYDDMTLIETQKTTNYTDTIGESGLYYYAIVARNEYGDSLVSNIESIHVLDASKKIFQNFSIGEILILAGIIGGFQLIITSVLVLFIRGDKTKRKSTKKKK